MKIEDMEGPPRFTDWPKNDPSVIIKQSKERENACLWRFLCWEKRQVRKEEEEAAADGSGILKKQTASQTPKMESVSKIQ